MMIKYMIEYFTEKAKEAANSSYSRYSGALKSATKNLEEFIAFFSANNLYQLFITQNNVLTLLYMSQIYIEGIDAGVGKSTIVGSESVRKKRRKEVLRYLTEKLELIKQNRDQLDKSFYTDQISEMYNHKFYSTDAFEFPM